MYKAQFAAFFLQQHITHTISMAYLIYTTVQFYMIFSLQIFQTTGSSDLLKERSRNAAVDIEIQEKNATGEETYSGLVIINDIQFADS